MTRCNELLPTYHVTRGNWIRIHRGLYRLAVFPESRFGQLIGWHLWSRDRKQVPQGVFSHLTALEVHSLFSETEKRIFITVPNSFRRTAKTPTMIILHKCDLLANEVIEVEGIRVTSIKRTLEDTVRSTLLPQDQLSNVFKQVFTMGLVEAAFVTALCGDQLEFIFGR